MKVKVYDYNYYIIGVEDILYYIYMHKPKDNTLSMEKLKYIAPVETITELIDCGYITINEEKNVSLTKSALDWISSKPRIDLNYEILPQIIFHLLLYCYWINGKDDNGMVVIDTQEIIKNYKISNIKIYKCCKMLEDAKIINLYKNTNHYYYRYPYQETNKSVKIESRKKKEYTQDVKMYPEEYDNLVSKFGEKATNEIMKILSDYKLRTGRTYKSDYLAILHWVIEAWRKREANTYQVKKVNVERKKL